MNRPRVGMVAPAALAAAVLGAAGGQLLPFTGAGAASLSAVPAGAYVWQSSPRAVPQLEVTGYVEGEDGSFINIHGTLPGGGSVVLTAGTATSTVSANRAGHFHCKLEWGAGPAPTTFDATVAATPTSVGLDQVEPVQHHPPA